MIFSYTFLNRTEMAMRSEVNDHKLRPSPLMGRTRIKTEMVTIIELKL